MRIGVIGTGAVGGTIAALLDRAGNDVEVTARGQQLAVIRERGLHLAGVWGEHTALVEASTTLQRVPELVFVCTKAQDSADAISANSALIDGVPVVVVQNGLTGLAEASALLPNSDCVGALAVFAASFLTPGEITVTAPGNIYLGTGKGEPSVPVLFATRVLEAAMPAIATSNFVGAQWTKLMVNQVNAMPAITGLSAQETLGDRRLRSIITRSIREATRIGFASGIRFGRVQGLGNGLLRGLSLAPTWVGQLVPLLMKRRMGATPNPGSTLQSLRRGQLTEIDYLNGAVVEQAVILGLSAPINAELVRLVHEVERTHEFFAPDAVADRMRSVA
ncbi:MAG: 2-dehydropantoate 2-reductase [Leifsonia sp.]|jgi:2-dehydropantoate 2-reductase|nr:2-dehydropantoate 2-reductase [Leifsonia sp.]MDQ1587727.1 2-dehydropantoate 2-reductase [Microbacteriaceae bacterium]